MKPSETHSTTFVISCNQTYPDFKIPYDLTTDASVCGIGAVLSQNITMISRILEDCELNYATNERELLAIVWAIGKLQNYLYGTKEVRIFTSRLHTRYPAKIPTLGLSDGKPLLMKTTGKCSTLPENKTL